MYDDRPPEYDVDDADEAWLAKANTAAAAEAGAAGGSVGGGGARGSSGRGGGGGSGGAGHNGGIIAAARGLYATVASRFRTGSGNLGTESPTARESLADGGAGSGPPALGVVEFERAIEKLELLHFTAVGKWWSDLNDGGFG
jgi:hypothetical protein